MLRCFPTDLFSLSILYLYLTILTLADYFVGTPFYRSQSATACFLYAFLLAGRAPLF
jgi:hypothetical protein